MILATHCTGCLLLTIDDSKDAEGAQAHTFVANKSPGGRERASRQVRSTLENLRKVRHAEPLAKRPHPDGSEASIARSLTSTEGILGGQQQDPSHTVIVQISEGQGIDVATDARALEPI